MLRARLYAGGLSIPVWGKSKERGLSDRPRRVTPTRPHQGVGEFFLSRDGRTAKESVNAIASTTLGP